jgi:hypothetical protein
MEVKQRDTGFPHIKFMYPGDVSMFQPCIFGRSREGGSESQIALLGLVYLQVLKTSLESIFELLTTSSI